MSEIILPDFDVKFQTDDLKCSYCGETADGLAGHDQNNFIPGSIVFCSLCGGCCEVDDNKKLSQLSLEAFDALSKDISFIVLEDELCRYLGKKVLPHREILKRTIL